MKRPTVFVLAACAATILLHLHTSPAPISELSGPAVEYRNSHGASSMLERMLAEHPQFVKEFAALARHSTEQQFMKALRADAATTGMRSLSQGAKDARVLSPLRQRKVRVLVLAKHQMLAKQLLAEEYRGGEDANSTSARAPVEHGAFNDWVLTLKPAAINMSNVSWGVWRTPDNSNAYNGMTKPVPNTNPFGEQIIDQDSDKYVNISDVEKGYDMYNPLFAALEGRGLPKMGYEQDIFAPCTDPEKCTPSNSKPNHPVRDTHSDPRTLQATEKPFSFDDEYTNCTDPNNPEFYSAYCDPARNRYGRPIRRGGFPDDPMIVEWRLNTQHMNDMVNRSIEAEQEHNFTIYRLPVTNAQVVNTQGPYLRTPYPNGVQKQPVAATGYYGGLAGPPFLTEGPVGSEFTYGVGGEEQEDKTEAGVGTYKWEDVGLGDGYRDAQSIVGQLHGRDTRYVYRYMDRQGFPLDRLVYQVDMGEREREREERERERERQRERERIDEYIDRYD